MSEITILHLSDIHFKKNKEDEDKAFRQEVQEKLIEAVTAHSKEHGAPDFVAVTGDIAFSGKEYNEARAFFKNLKTVLPTRIIFLVVPGNHDVDRNKISNYFSLHSIVQNKEKIDQLLENPKEINTHINYKFKAFREFVVKLNPGLYQNADDYFWVKNFKDKNVSFLGLNSCWACENDQDRNNITLGFPQVMDALRKSKISNRIVLMHHPPINWLNEVDFNRYSVEMFHNCHLLLHGHVHAVNALILKNPQGSCICLGANASYTNNKNGFIGFQCIEAEFREKEARVRVWPYRWDNRGRNRFFPDYNRWAGQDGPYFELKTFIDESKKKKPILPLKIPQKYKEWINEFHSTLPVDQLARKGEVILISLPQVYIPLEAARPSRKPKDEIEMRKKSRGEEPETIDIEELLGRDDCLLLRGNAGMGKTTLVKHLAYSLTHDSHPTALKGYLPVMVFLKDLWPIYKNELQKEAATITFEMLLELYLNKSVCPLTIETVITYLSQQRLLLLLDGLDEVPEVIRDKLVELLRRFQFENKGNRFLITGRPHGIEGGAIHRFGKYLRDIEYMDDKKVEEFISKWFRAVSGQASGIADLTAVDMISDIRLHEHAGVFTRNPLLLTALCIFYLVGGKRVPDQRADLYDRIVSNLLFRNFHDPLDPEKVNNVREFLMFLAFTMQELNIKNIEIIEAKKILNMKYPQKEDESPILYKKRMEKLFDEIEPGCGLLNRMGSGEIEFTHLTFQEFLTAKHMLDMDIDYKEYLENPWWEETILLYIGLMNLEMKKRSNSIIVEILNMKQPRIQLLGAKALRDFQPSKREERAVALARKKLINLIESDIDAAELFEATESHLKKVEELENKARHLIKDQEYFKARFVLKEVLELEPECEIAMQNEFGFLYDFKNTPEKDQEHWIEKKEVINHWKNLWCVLSENNNFPLKINETKKSTLSPEEEKPVEKQEESEKTKESTVGDDISHLPPHEKGEMLEIAALRLFRKFFKIAKDVEETILINLRKQKKSLQFGHDISFECISRNNEKVTCKIECKNMEDSITEKDISHKLLAVEDSDQKIDHWILFSARSDPSSYLNELLASWKEKERFPFEIHFWTPDSGIKEFFGLEPGIYEKFYGNETINNIHPKDWTEQKQREVYEDWKEKLKVKPFARLPKVWKEYIKDPGKMLLKEERNRSEELKTIYHNRVELRCKDKKGMLLDGTMEDHVRQWLEDEKKNVMFILGEFGAGKTAFTYFLSRNLGVDFLNDTVNGWIPVRFSLKYYQSAKDPQAFLQKRLAEFNADLGSWYDLRNEKKKILIILDGFDEMTPKLDQITIRQNISNLTDCCNEEFEGMKIIITSRTHFFEDKQDENLLLQRLGEPPIFYLAPIERPKRIEYLEKSMKDPQSKEILSKMCKSHDPLGLASKPLFLHMFELVIEEIKDEKLDQKHINEITIYEYYIEQTLKRKVKLLDSEKLSNLKDLVSKLIELLEQIAIKFQESNLEYISLIDFSSDLGRNYDEILWETSDSDNQVNETENKYDSSEDAAARVQVRSLLSRVDVDNIEEKRPVEFCHRSMREYFVAKGICRALVKDKKRAGELLTKLPLNHEIQYFTSQLMKKDNSPNYKKNLLEITKSSSNKINTKTPGGNSITLLFRLLGALPNEDWSDLNLDGANLSGADISNMNFIGTLMRNAKLDNVIFEGADFSNSDLTGVRIEETAPVLAVTTRHLDNRIFAAYKDNTIREWKSILKTGDAESRIVLGDTKGNVIGLEIFNGSFLCAVTNEEMIFYEFNDKEKLIQKARFRIKPGYRRQVTKGNILLLLSEIEKQTNKLHLVDLDKFEEVDSLEQEKISLCENLDLQAFAVTDGKEYLRVEGTQQIQNEEILDIALQEATSLCVYTCKRDKQYLLACGQSNGNVSVWQLERLNGKWDHKLLVKNQVHDGMVSTLSFLDDARIVSGGIDRKISILKFGEDPDDLKGHQENILHMTIKCKGMKIDDLKGDKEQEMFKKLIQNG